MGRLHLAKLRLLARWAGEFYGHQAARSNGTFVRDRAERRVFESARLSVRVALIESPGKNSTPTLNEQGASIELPYAQDSLLS